MVKVNKMGNQKIHQEKHPAITTLFLITICVPTIPVGIIIGCLLKILWPKPVFWQILLAIPLMVIAMGLALLVGGLIFLLAAKPFIKKEILEPFYIYPNVPVMSRLSSMLFTWIYGNHLNKK